MEEPQHLTVADPGFPVGGADLIGGHQLLRRLHFEKFVCQNKRIWTLGGARAGGAAPWTRQCLSKGTEIEFLLVCRFQLPLQYQLHCWAASVRTIDKAISDSTRSKNPKPLHLNQLKNP